MSILQWGAIILSVHKPGMVYNIKILNAGVMWTCNRLLMIITELSPM